jgi:50S ribosomal protein L16 3-hydroxylase
LGENLSEPKAGVWFEPGAALQRGQGLKLHPRSRMVYDDHHIYINGESWRAAGADARLLRQLADDWQLDAHTLTSISVAARELLADWLANGWLISY